jgi:hypothetical protein
MFILMSEVDSITKSIQEDNKRVEKELEIERKRKEEAKQAEETKKANEKKAAELREKQEATRAKTKGIFGLSNPEQAQSIQQRRETSSAATRTKISNSAPGESSKIAKDAVNSEISNLQNDLESLPEGPNKARDKEILQKEIAQLKQEQRHSAKFESDQKQKELNAGYKAGNRYDNRFKNDVNLDPGVQEQRQKTLDKADRILNEPGYASQLAYNNNHTSTFGDPSVSSWARDRMRLGEMSSGGGDAAGGSSGITRKGSAAKNDLAGGDIDFKNAKGSVSNIAGKRFYAPDKNKPDDVYEVKRNPHHDLHESHQVVKQMIEGTLDEDGMKDLGLEFKKTSYKTELAQHKERKAKGILTPEQTERKQEALASAASRKEFLQGSLAHANPIQAYKIQGKLDKIDNLITRQQGALDKSTEALADASPDALKSMGLASVEPEKNDSGSIAQLSSNLDASIASRDVNGIKAVVSRLSGNDSATDLNSKAQSALDQINAENKTSTVA